MCFNDEIHNAVLIAETIMHAIFNGTEETKNDTIRSINVAMVLKYAETFLVRRKNNPNNIVIKDNNTTITIAKKVQ